MATSNQKMEGIENCPYCKGEAITVFMARVIYKVSCTNTAECLAQRPFAITEADAVARWNAVARKVRAVDSMPAWLAGSTDALLDLDARKALVPHGIGGHARSLLEEFLKMARAALAGGGE